MTLFLAGLLLGLAGSAHCVFMCGPLVLTARRSTTSRVPWFLPYHTGRLLMYELLALAAGLAGRVVAVGGMGRALSVACGVVVLMVAAGKAPVIARRVTGTWARALSRVSLTAGSAVRTRPLMGQFVAGGVNGLLPCGLAYTAAVAAAALGGVPQSLIFMAGFGIGTLPALLVVSLSAASMPLAVRMRLRRVAPLALAVTGVLLIVRGLVPPVHSGGSHMPSAAASHAHHQP
jgi:sulfite exporter TauE/SafE